ncbi:hypothetical protein, partial [Marinobacter sp. SS8-8]|uniref:hypothetical protein n=1 Tax=Marinobacter sp. SS8-8 TaxID=3050452 RepID=UPI0026DFACAF
HDSILDKLNPFSFAKPGAPLPAGALSALYRRTVAKQRLGVYGRGNDEIALSRRWNSSYSV